MQSIGVSRAKAKIIFILPTPPKGQYRLNKDSELTEVSVENIISQDGNHWRKILTIMAKLSCSNNDWRSYRDNQLLTQHERIEFKTPERFKTDTLYFICGQAMQQNVTEQASLHGWQALNEKGSLLVKGNLILCPYLDYRQFPNADIELTRRYLTRCQQ